MSAWDDDDKADNELTLGALSSFPPPIYVYVLASISKGKITLNIAKFVGTRNLFFMSY